MSGRAAAAAAGGGACAETGMQADATGDATCVVACVVRTVWAGRGQASASAAWYASHVASLKHINRTGGVVAGALPLLYGMAEGIVEGATYQPAPPDAAPEPARPASGTRRSRLHETVGYESVGS